MLINPCKFIYLILIIITLVVKLAGYHVVYDGLTYATVRGAGHEVSRSHANVLYAMFIKLLNNELL